MSLIPHGLLFETRQRIARIAASQRSKLQPLDEQYRLRDQNGLDGRTVFADLRVGWNEAGLLFDLRVEGKQQAPLCDVDKPEGSDGLLLWIDTRNTPGVHRANRFCHLFCAQPTGAGKNRQSAFVVQQEIGRCREASPLANSSEMACESKLSKRGYSMTVWLGSKALNGFDPEQSPVLGFYYAVRDRELGTQTFGLGEEFPYRTDPTLWQSLEMKHD